MCRYFYTMTLAMVVAFGLATESYAEAPKIYRGAQNSPAAKSTIVQHPKALPERPRPAALAVGGSGDLTVSGNRLWMVDRIKGTVTACRLVNTINVGQTKIECFKRRVRGLKARQS